MQHSSPQALLDETIQSIRPVDKTLRIHCQHRLDNLTKPQGSLGYLEDIVTQYCLATHTASPRLGGKTIFTFAADHGVTAEGISPSEQAVTMQMIRNMLQGTAAINILAEHAGAQLRLIDVGVCSDFSDLLPAEQAKLLRRSIRRGTNNMARGPAMSEADALAALSVGITMAKEVTSEGTTLLGTGEMGVGNTTAAAALMCAFTTFFAQHPALAKRAGITPAPVTADTIVGCGAGLDPALLSHKAAVVAKALHCNRKRLTNPLAILSAVGGLELAAICGLILGGAAHGAGIVVDGYISTAAALAAIALCPAVKEYCFFSHQSAEGAHAAVLEALDVRPILTLDMRLGEGTGAALAMQIVEAAVKLYNSMATFDTAGVTRINTEKDLRC